MQTNTESIHFMNALVSNLDSGVLSYNMEGYVTLVNAKAIDYLCIKGVPEEIVDTEVVGHIALPALVDEMATDLQLTRKEFQLQEVYYGGRYLNITGRKMLDGMLLSITDITDNVLSKDRATQSLLLGQEMERRRLAKEIHDGVGPNMSTLKLQIDAVRKRSLSDAVVAGLEDISTAISAIANDIRQISHDLMPSSLIDFGVVTALSNYAKKISQSSDIEVHYQSNIVDGQLTKEYELNIYRMAQELVNNALKYSKCKNIEISLRQDDENINLLVEDDGVGMDVQRVSRGIGIHNIKARVQSLRGTIDLESQPGNGVTAYIDLPLSPPASA